MKSFRLWCAPFISPTGKWAKSYNDLTDEQKLFYKEAYKVYQDNPTKYRDIEDYYNYKTSKIKYTITNIFRKGGK